jgi:hypothetical protein
MTDLGTTTLATADGLYLLNSTAATAGLNAQQAPRIRLGAKVWDGAASRSIEWLLSIFPRITGTGTSTLDFSAAYAGKGTTTVMSLSPFGYVAVGTSSPLATFTVIGPNPANNTAATTTVDFGDWATSTSRSCFNAKNIAGTSVSFYFSGTTMVVENNRCR